MRAGLAFARAFALARRIPIYGIDVFAALRLSVGQDTLLAIDSRRGDYFIDEITAEALGLPNQWIVDGKGRQIHKRLRAPGA